MANQANKTTQTYSDTARGIARDGRVHSATYVLDAVKQAHGRDRGFGPQMAIVILQAYVDELATRSI